MAMAVRQPGKTGIETLKAVGTAVNFSGDFDKNDRLSKMSGKMKANSIIFYICAGICVNTLIDEAYSMNFDMKVSHRSTKGIYFDEEDPFGSTCQDIPSYTHRQSNFNDATDNSFRKEWREHVQTMNRLGVHSSQYLNEDIPPPIDRINEVLDEELGEFEYGVRRVNERFPEHQDAVNDYMKYYKKKKNCCVIL